MTCSVSKLASSRSPQLTNRLSALALETIPELTRIGHGTENPSPLRRVGIGVDALDSRLLARLAAPPVGITNEEQLFLREEVQARQTEVGRLGGAFLPSLERGRQAACVGDILAQREAAVDVQRLAVGAFDREVRVLVDETLGFILEVRDRLICPPVRVVPVLVVVASGRVERV